MLAYEDAAPAVLAYFILLEFSGSNVARIRDFLYAPYAIDEASHHRLTLLDG